MSRVAIHDMANTNICLLIEYFKYSSDDLLNCTEINLEPIFNKIIITPAKNLLLFKNKI